MPPPVPPGGCSDNSSVEPTFSPNNHHLAVWARRSHPLSLRFEGAAGISQVPNDHPELREAVVDDDFWGAGAPDRQRENELPGSGVAQSPYLQRAWWTSDRAPVDAGRLDLRSPDRHVLGVPDLLTKTIRSAPTAAAASPSTT